MKIAETYSHLNGEEYLLVHCPEQWQEVRDVISDVDAASCRTKQSQEKTKKGQLLYSPIDMNKSFEVAFAKRGWSPERRYFYSTSDHILLREVLGLPSDEQKRVIAKAGKDPIRSYNQTDFVKDRIAVEVQFGKYSFVAHDLFVKHMSFFVSDVIDVGIEILPMKSLEREMSSGVPYYERDLLNVLRQGRGIPAVPLVIIGVVP